MFRSHLAAAVCVVVALATGDVRASDNGTIYWSPWNSGGSFETIPDEFIPRYDLGYGAGYPIGYKSGFGEGQVRGRKEGWANGEAAGRSAGWDAAYPLAFNLAYDAAYPAAHRAGWESGLGEGFEEGYDYAPVVLEILNNRYGGGGYGASGIISFSSGFYWGDGDITGLEYLVWRDSTNSDWSKLAYDEGFKKGKSEGHSAGSTDGYNDTYGVTYDKAFPIGHQLGIWEGTSAGKREGGSQGQDEGFDAGYSLGFDAGFTAGIEYRLFDGWYAEPRYALQYSRRSDALTASTLVAMNAPEPGTALLLAVGGAFALARVRRARFAAAA